ncbi:MULTISPECIES: DUF4959 domain-containing protein [Aestuariibaculum]|uniref:DUF4959 domain-containing protein n=1 Tax=Aestuariibaculum lutulentum TaxID=2920935 RepID=A0ABS9RDV4_9FLAO|nr:MULTISPECIES: DUF4959 domain-containing protein [Aestuariibaculum]MCH4551116.1 DUF4959 domain-containing protein [Aestuariibaculum lutulentum]MCR8666181.1 DUF4959 domain-containing protein [Aestuariibaculum sp. M13]
MKQNIIKFSWIAMLALIVVFSACSEEQGPSPLENNTTPPGIVENVVVENLPGKVKLEYTLPDDKDLLYVVARYTLENGTPMEVKASYYQNSMLLEGFTGQSEEEVEIYAVNRSETESDPVTVTVAPLEAPIYEIFRSLETNADFGGVRINALNPTEEDIALLVMQKNVQGDWEPLSTSIYTSVDTISRSIRGYDPVPQDFAFVVRDRWLNTTDTLFAEITPIFEMLMPREEMLPITLPNDAELIAAHTEVRDLFNGGTLEWYDSFFTSRTIDVGNHLVTFDIGRQTKLSRLHIWNFSEPIGGQRLYYYLGAMRKFRIWGANELNDGNLEDGTWTLMGEYEIIKPSGLPYGQEDNNDLIAAQDGADYEIDIEKPAVRFLRIECLLNWANGQYMAVSEVQVFGNPNL